MIPRVECYRKLRFFFDGTDQPDYTHHADVMTQEDLNKCGGSYMPLAKAVNHTSGARIDFRPPPAVIKREPGAQVVIWHHTEESRKKVHGAYKQFKLRARRDILMRRGEIRE